MKKIYCFINNKEITNWNDVIALAEDGHFLTNHISSDKYWAQHDIGLTSDWKHDIYEKYYPDGYELVWLDNPESDKGWLAAIEYNNSLGKEAELPEDQRAGVTITCE